MMFVVDGSDAGRTFSAGNDFLHKDLIQLLTVIYMQSLTECVENQIL